MQALTFVDSLAAQHTPAVKGPPKLFHKKSRHGCQRCKARRVKCNEKHPICGNCDRHNLACTYGNPGRKSPSESGPEPETARTATVTPERTCKPPSQAHDLNPPESETRRRLELKLLHYYITVAGPTLGFDEMGTEAFVRAVPCLALEHEALLYSMFLISALHLLNSDRTNIEARDAYQSYLALVLQEHTKDVEGLSMSNVDAVCLTSTLLRAGAFAMLQDRDLEPYTAPTLWLRLQNDAVHVFEMAWELSKDDDSSVTLKLIKRMPILVDEKAKFAESNRRDFLYLLRRTPKDIAGETWDEEIEEAYKSTISYIGNLWLAMEERISGGEIIRRILVFGMMIKKSFIRLVEQHQPRALSVLAHYFCILSMFSGIWWFEESGTREVRAIQATLPPEWQDLMVWPLEIITSGREYYVGKDNT